MTQRINYYATCPRAVEILMQQEQYLRTQFSDSAHVSIELWELVKLRVSQINHCAFCIEMHSYDLLQMGTDVARLLGLDAWQEMPIYTDLEKTVFGFVELLLSGTPIDDHQYETVLATLGDKDLVNLTVAVNAINSWNRIAKLFKPVIGSLRKN